MRRCAITVYADVLFVMNFFVTFFLLMITSKLSKKQISVPRFILASAFGGLYSMVLLLPDLSEVALLLSKTAVCALIVFSAFKFYKIKNYFFTVLVFLVSNFIMLGFVVGAYFLFGSQKIIVRNSVIYFDIGAKGLLISAFFAYVVSSFVVRLYSRRLSKKETYKIIINNGGKEVAMPAMLDSGNRLREPFSGAPVIVASSKMCAPLAENSPKRLIPANTVSGGAMLVSFKPELVVIKTKNGREVIENVYIALSDNISGAYCAVLSPDILSI